MHANYWSLPERLQQVAIFAARYGFVTQTSDILFCWAAWFIFISLIRTSTDYIPLSLKKIILYSMKIEDAKCFLVIGKSCLFFFSFKRTSSRNVKLVDCSMAPKWDLHNVLPLTISHTFFLPYSNCFQLTTFWLYTGLSVKKLEKASRSI